ncbi:hypothetical protein [Aneurinibacillus sp. REN35]|uniref:hypothetical protein n=1 Tax=Aneurinibacillus sp. REN35 TaxID=3237286 RepID=UPI003526CA67
MNLENRVKGEFSQDFVEDSTLLGERSEIFNFIFKNQYEVYFIKYINELKNPEEIWEYENEIYDYQSNNISNNNDFIYNLNFVVFANKINESTRRILEQDKYTSKKIIIDVNNFDEDIELLPFKRRLFDKTDFDKSLDELIIAKCAKLKPAKYILDYLKTEEINEESIDKILDILGDNND